MPAVAWKNGSSKVSCSDGAKGPACAFDEDGNPIRWKWTTDTTQDSNTGSDTVFANNIGVVRKDDTMQSHPHGDPCVSSPVNHAPALTTYSSNVYANNLPIGRVGDKYNKSTGQDHTIVNGSPNVFAN